MTKLLKNFPRPQPKLFLPVLLIIGLFPLKVQAIGPAALLLVLPWLGPLLLSIAAFFGLLVEIGLRMIEAAISPQSEILRNFAHLDIVAESWKIVRDFANMFFILILVIISFGTIFNIRDYHARDTLPKLIIIALIVNFSLVISTFIIDIANSIGMFFGSAIGDISTETMNSLSLIKSITTALPGGATAVAASFFLALTLQIIAGLTLISTGVILFLRIPALWLAIIFAPVALAAWILPRTRDGYDYWQKQFLYWNYFFIVFIFFLYIGFILIRAFDKFAGATGLQPAILENFTIFLILKYLLTIMVFIIALNIARLMGGVASQATSKITGAGKRAFVMPGKKIIGKVGGKIGLTSIDKKAISPKQVIATLASNPNKENFALTIDLISKAVLNLKDKLTGIESLEKQEKLLNDFEENGTREEQIAVLIWKARTGKFRDFDKLNKIIYEYQNRPIVIIKIFNALGQGNFEGMSNYQFFYLMKDTTRNIPLESRREMAEFLTAEEGKKFAAQMSYNDFRFAYELLGKNATKGGANLREKIKKTRPELVAKYEAEKERVVNLKEF